MSQQKHLDFGLFDKGRAVVAQRQSQPPRPRSASVVIPIAHPNQLAIVALLAGLINGSDEDVCGTATKIQDLLLTDAPCMRIARIDFKGQRGEPRSFLKLLSLWSAYPLLGDEAEDAVEGVNKGKMLWKDQNSRQFVVGVARAAAAEALGLQPATPAPQSAPVIPEGKAPQSAPVSAGDQEVLP